MVQTDRLTRRASFALTLLERPDDTAFVPEGITGALPSASSPFISATDNGSEPSMNAAARNKRNYLAAKAAFNAGDIAGCVAYYAPEHQIMSPPQPPGRDGIRRFFEQSRAAWRDLRLVVENAVAEDDWVMGRSVATAVLNRPMAGVAATGETIETTFWDLHRFNEDGLIVQTWNLMAPLPVQLGAGFGSKPAG